jgi:hypothetical protein
VEADVPDHPPVQDDGVDVPARPRGILPRLAQPEGEKAAVVVVRPPFRHRELEFGAVLDERSEVIR